MKNLTIEETFQLVTNGTLVLDMRSEEEFRDGHLSNALYVSRTVTQEPLFEILVPHETPYVLVVSSAKAHTALTFLLDLGYKSPQGVFIGDVEEFFKDGGARDIVVGITAEELIIDINHGKPEVIDIRSAFDYHESHLKKAQHIPATELIRLHDELPKDRTFYLYGADSRLALFIASWLQTKGLYRVYVVEGGFAALVAAEAPVENSVGGPNPIQDILPELED